MPPRRSPQPPVPPQFQPGAFGVQPPGSSVQPAATPRPKRKPSAAGSATAAEERARRKTPPPAPTTSAVPKRASERPPPTAADAAARRRNISPDGRWELDAETGQWIPLSGAPIGVAADYRPVVPGPGPAPGVAGRIPVEDVAGTYAPRGVLPKYFDGDEYTIGAGLSPETIAGIQQSLQDAGIISPTTALPYGMWDNTTAGAMKQILATANVNGVDWQVAFEQSVSEAIALTGGGYLNEEGVPYSEIPAPPPPLEMPPGYLANPAELKAVVQQVAQRTIGRKVDNAFLDQFVTSFQAMQSSNFYGESTTSDISPETAAEEFIEGDWGDEAEAMQLSNVLDVVDGMLAGPFGGAG